MEIQGTVFDAHYSKIVDEAYPYKMFVYGRPGTYRVLRVLENSGK